MKRENERRRRGRKRRRKKEEEEERERERERESEWKRLRAVSCPPTSWWGRGRAPRRPHRSRGGRTRRSTSPAGGVSTHPLGMSEEGIRDERERGWVRKGRREEREKRRKEGVEWKWKANVKEIRCKLIMKNGWCITRKEREKLFDSIKKAALTTDSPFTQ